MSHAESAARSALRNVQESTVLAMRALDRAEPLTLSGLLAAVLTATASDSDEVQEHAALIVAEVYAGTPGTGAARTLHAANRARSLAGRTVAMASAEVNLYGTAEDCAVLLDGDSPEAVTVAMPETPQPDRSARVTFSDMTATVAGSLARKSPGSATGLERAIADYRRHADGDCGEGESCATRVGRRVTLAGVTAHLEGWTPADAAFHRARRATGAALRAVPGHGLTVEAAPWSELHSTGAARGGVAWEAWNALADTLGDAAPMATRTVGRNSLSARDCQPGTLAAPYSTLRHARTLTVTTRATATVHTPAREESTVPGARMEWMRAGMEYDRAVRAMARAGWIDVNGYPLALGYSLDSLGYSAAYGYGRPVEYAAVDAAEERCTEAERRDPAPRSERVSTVARYSVERVAVEASAYPFPTLDVLAVTRDGAHAHRMLTDEERDTIRTPRPGRTVLPALDADNGGTAPHMSPQSGDAYRAPLADGGMVRARPRKGARSGQTGPTVPVRLTR